MPKYYNPDLLDFGLDRIRSKIAAGNTVTLRMLTAYAQGDSYATAHGNSILSIALAQVDLTLGNQGTLGRQVQVGAKSGTASAASQQYENSTATAGAATTLTDSAKAWTSNEHAGRVVIITGGTGSGQHRRIASNTGTVLTVDTAWTTNPDATSTYVIRDDLHIAVVDETESKVLAATDETSNQVINSGATVNLPAFALKMNQPV